MGFEDEYSRCDHGGSLIECELCYQELLVEAGIESSQAVRSGIAESEEDAISSEP